MSDIFLAKQRLPLPELMHRLGLEGHAKKSARCPFHDDRHNSFSVWQYETGTWFWKCHAGCGEGDEITFLEKLKGVSNSEAIKLYLEMAGVKKTPRLKVLETNEQTFDWRSCVDALTDKHVEQIAEWRGYSVSFVKELRNKGQIGIYEGLVAFRFTTLGRL
jgi:DNA primase